MLSMASGLCTLFLAITAPRAEPPSARPSPQASALPAHEGVVNLNEATAEELERLPGIGPAKAKAIVDQRKAHPFRKVDDLVKVKGIGKKTLAKLRPFVTLSGPTTLAAEVHAKSK
jgi:competence protein ComEA